jgi:UDP-N-acetylmuramoyl-L-alanyl-D-glutamate--2,6-diaminopimelate ligase
VSSHGLDQQRVQGVQWNAAVFTNLSADHLDYHGNVETYAAVKARLFHGGTGRVPAISVVNLDDAAGRRLAAELGAQAPTTRVITYGEAPDAQVRAERVQLEATRTTFRICWPAGAFDVESPLVGRANVSNLLAAVATAWGLGRDPLVLLARLRAFPGVPGRMERIVEGQPFQVWVDAAHTADTLRQALQTIRQVTTGRLLVVYGCGGNRDRAERPGATRAVQELADFAVATADSPRSEALPRIFADMRAGVTAPERIAWIEDRRRALNMAFALARPGDSVVVAGRGHEMYQEMADTVVPFDDRLVARELLRDRRVQPEA